MASTKLNEAQERAAHLVATGLSGKAVAAELGVTPETVSRWRQEPAFQAAINSLLWDARDNVQRRMASLADKALTIVTDALDNAELPVAERLKVAFKVLDMYGAPGLAQQQPGPSTTEGVEMQALLKGPFD